MAEDTLPDLSKDINTQLSKQSKHIPSWNYLDIRGAIAAKVLSADAIYASNRNRRFATQEKMATCFVLKGKQVTNEAKKTRTKKGTFPHYDNQIHAYEG
jgi:hypothetical protein